MFILYLIIDIIEIFLGLLLTFLELPAAIVAVSLNRLGRKQNLEAFERAVEDGKFEIWMNDESRDQNGFIKYEIVGKHLGEFAVFIVKEDPAAGTREYALHLGKTAYRLKNAAKDDLGKPLPRIYAKLRQKMRGGRRFRK